MPTPFFAPMPEQIDLEKVVDRNRQLGNSALLGEAVETSINHHEVTRGKGCIIHLKQILAIDNTHTVCHNITQKTLSRRRSDRA
ncbi:MAG: hypothetical protein IIX22_06375 [Ruminococcus sp.]|nr:hypothetical protein [Ruminococcus sp.]